MFDIKKFRNEILALRKLPADGFLHPLQREQIKQKVLLEISKEPNVVYGPYAETEKTNNIVRYIVSTLLGLSLVAGTALASNNSRPGDFLFPVKKAAEQVQISLAPTDQAKAKLQTKFAEERLNELSETAAVASSTPAALKAQTQAEHEVNNALDSLQQVQVKLQAKGDTETADAVSQTISHLQASIKVGSESNNFGQGEGNNSNRENTTATATSTAASTEKKLENTPHRDISTSIPISTTGMESIITPGENTDKNRNSGDGNHSQKATSTDKSILSPNPDSNTGHTQDGQSNQSGNGGDN